MSKRMEAVMRVIAGVWTIPAAIGAYFALLAGIVWMVVDVVWQFILGSDGLSSDGTLGSGIVATIRWPVDLTVFAVAGDGEMLWLPDL